MLLAGVFATLGCAGSIEHHRPPFPERAANARSGREVMAAVNGASLEDREDVLVREILEGNVPDRLRHFVDVDVHVLLGGVARRVRLFVLPDYLGVGGDVDFVRTPLSPQAAQLVADRTSTTLPTPRIVDATWEAAGLKLAPRPIAPTVAMTSVPVFVDHHRIVEALRPPGSGTPGETRAALVAGHKKDVVLTPRLIDLEGRVAIYGWHRLDGRPIQPLYTGHTDRWVDYSHGVRLVSRRVLVDGVEHDLVELLRDPSLAFLVSGDGAIPTPRSRAGPR